VLRVSEVEVARPPPKRVAQIMEGAGSDPLPRTRPAALRTRPMRVIPTAPDKLRRREHLGIGDAQGGVRRVDCRTEHGTALRSKGLFPLILRLGPRSVILKLPTMGLKSLFFCRNNDVSTAASLAGERATALQRDSPSRGDDGKRRDWSGRLGCGDH